MAALVCTDDRYLKAEGILLSAIKALAEAGIPARAYPAAGKNHTTINADLGLPNDWPTQEMLTFLGSVLNRQ